MTQEQSAPKLLNQAIDGLKQASGGCSQLLHTRTDPRWLVLRQAIDLTTDGLIGLATFAASQITGIKK